VIYNADCRDILPHLESVDLVLTDPPYGIGEDGGRFRDRKGGYHRVLPKMGWDKEPPDFETFKLFLNVGKEQLVWGGNYFTDKLPVSRGWLYWDKMMGGDFSDGELAWTSKDMVLKSFSFCNKVAGKEHPTQKPLELILWCFSFFPETKSILDPFMGSGTTLRAAKDLGRKAIGIEIEEKYCEIAVKRLQQEVLKF
jgi:site-specific DNA-methyltransferase (adenine-specific)